MHWLSRWGVNRWGIGRGVGCELCREYVVEPPDGYQIYGPDGPIMLGFRV